MLFLPRPKFLYKKIHSQLMSYPLHPSVFGEIWDSFDLNLMDHTLKPLGGNRGTNILLQTSKGKKLLKKYKSTLGKSTIIQEHSILMYLENIGFPAPRLFSTKTGDTLLKFRDHYYALFDFIEKGFQYYNFLFFPRQSNEFTYMSGRTLGHLHKSLKNFNPQGFNPDGFKSKVKDRWRNLEWYKKKLSECKRKSADCKSEFLRKKFLHLFNKTDYLKEELSRLDNLLQKSNLIRSIIHGDYGPYNLLFQKNGPTVVLDFEMARLDWRMVDIIQAWHRFCHSRFGYNLKRMKLFLNAYQEQTLLSSIELKLIGDVWKHINMRGLIRNLYNYSISDKVSSLEAAIKSLDKIEWINKNSQTLLRYLIP